MTKPHTLGGRLAQARREMAVREHRDVTAAEVAKAAGVSSASLSQWENDERLPRDPALIRLAQYLGVTPAFLRYGIEDTPPPVAAADYEEGARAHLARTKKAAPHKAAPKKRRA